MAKSKKPTRPLFSFDQDCTNSLTLNYGTMQWTVTSEHDEWSDEELELWEEIVNCLNHTFMPPV